MITKLTVFAACALLFAGCASVMNVDADRSPTFSTVGRTQNIPGRPDRDFVYSVGLGPASDPSNLNLLPAGTLPAVGAMIAAPETVRLTVSGRREGVSTNITWSETARNGKLPQEHVFHSESFAVSEDFAMRATLEVRYVAQSGDPIIQALSPSGATISEYSAPAKLSWRAGPATRPFEVIPGNGFELAAATFEADGSPCIRVRLYALGDERNALDFSAPMLGAVTFKFASLLDFVSVEASGASIVELDPFGPQDGWRTQCVGVDQGGEEPPSVRRRFDREDRQVNDFVFNGASRGWSAISLEPGSSLASVIYYPDREGRELTVTDFEFVRPVRALLLRRANIRAGGE